MHKDTIQTTWKFSFQKKMILLIVSSLSIGFIIYTFYPLYNESSRINPLPGRYVFYDRNGELITELPKKTGYFITYTWSLDNDFTQNLIKIEDQEFYHHFGINFRAKVRSLVDNMESGQIVSWGSTITEQYIKNYYFIEARRTILQKIRESSLALYLSITRTKVEILREYLNTLYMGNNIYGIHSAINVYFGKDDLSELTTQEQIILLSIIKYPGIKTLKEKHFVDYAKKIQSRLHQDQWTIDQTFLPSHKDINIFPFVTNKIIQSLTDDTNQEVIIHATIDAKLQTFAIKKLQSSIENLKSKNLTNGAIFAFNPQSWDILVYQGSKDFHSKEIDGQVDMTQRRRSIWSALKPFIYLFALESGANPDDFILDIEKRYEIYGTNKFYYPTNYNLREYKIVRLKEALWNSLNIATVRLVEFLWLHAVFQAVKDFWIDFDHDIGHYYYSFPLGSPELTLQNVVESYAKLNINIEDVYKARIHQDQSKEKAKQGITTNTPNKIILKNILSDPKNRILSFWINSILNTSILQSVKTGTSVDFKDNWTFSYSPTFTIGIWVGNNDNSSMEAVNGITGAWTIWHAIIEEAIRTGYIKNEPYLENEKWLYRKYLCLDYRCFQKESIITKRQIDYKSRILEKNYFLDEFFIKPEVNDREKLNEFKIH